jgi:CubicO group peptidase (beta-lactamase class C family)
MKKIIFGILGILLVALIIWIGFSYTGSTTSQFKGPVKAGEPLPEALIADLEKYVHKLMRQNDVPGVSMVLVQGDKVIYAKGLGVRDLRTKQPVDTETLMGIGSTTKSMTAVMIASLVDDGVIRWDTPLTQVLPTFALSRPDVTQAVTFRHTLCMCSTVPDYKEAIIVNFSEKSAEDVIEMMAEVPLKGSFEHTFNYSSPMVAVGGYLAALAAGGEYGHLSQDYAHLMQARIFDPLEMTSSTFSIEEAVASGNYATPYYSALSGYEAISPNIEGVFTPLTPAAALWSNADDLAKYLLMLLNGGVAANGRRVISQENLAYLWQPQVAIDANFSYGLGWDIEDYHGLTVIHHPGGTAGFASELVVIPDLNIGFALLSNRMDLTRPLGRMATYRLLEMLTGSEQVYDREVRKTARDMDRQLIGLKLVTRKTVDPDKIAPFLGTYEHDKLGEVKLVLHDDHTLWVDFGEYESSIRPLVLEENQYIFFESIFISKTIRLSMKPDGTPTMFWTGADGSYYLSQTSTQE